MPNIENQNSNFSLLKLLRTGISPLSAMIGTSAYYGQLIGNPILGSINALLFSKKLGIDIWNLNQMPSTKTKLLNSSKKILLGLGTIGLINYSKFINEIIEPITPTPDPWPTSTIMTSTMTNLPWSTLMTASTTTSTTTSISWSTLYPASTVSTTTIDPWPPILKLNNNPNHLMDWDTYLSLNAYGIANLIAGVTELIPNRFENVRKIANMITGGALISSGVAMGINNDFNNAYAIPTIVAGTSEIVHNLLPMETANHNEEMQETTFINEHANLINASSNDYENQRQRYGSNDSIDSLTSDVLFQQPIYRPTTYNGL